jgi:hypothetical protein
MLKISRSYGKISSYITKVRLSPYTFIVFKNILILTYSSVLFSLAKATLVHCVPIRRSIICIRIPSACPLSSDSLRSFMRVETLVMLLTLAGHPFMKLGRKKLGMPCLPLPLRVNWVPLPPDPLPEQLASRSPVSTVYCVIVSICSRIDFATCKTSMRKTNQREWTLRTGC